MKKLYFILVAAVAMSLTSCHKDILSELDGLHTHIDSLEIRVTALEQQCKQMNADIAALQTIVAAIQQNDMITNISGNDKDGYIVTFLSGKTLTISNGKEGTDGYTPIIGVRQDGDGTYYWTLDGEWLLDDNNNKIPVTGTDGTDGNTPKLKIHTDGYWYMSLDNGNTWTQVGQATGDSAESMFSAVTYTDTAVTFTLANGTVLIVPFAATTTDTYTLIYNPNGGNGTNDTVTVWNQQVVTISACTFTREGYGCIKWNTQPDGTGMTYKVGSSIVLADNLTLYAQWTASFSVSATEKVIFAPGNLQYQASTSTWHFAEHQYDYIGDANKNISATYDGWIDLFGWGTGNKPTNTSTSNSDYSTFTDWGKNAIGIYPADFWRTLTSVEWGYIFNTRTNASSLYGFATVNGTKGLILLPDSWSLPSGLTFKAGTAVFTNNVYSATQWSQMESAGAVFLPAVGFRYGMSVSYVQLYGATIGQVRWMARTTRMTSTLAIITSIRSTTTIGTTGEVCV